MLYKVIIKQINLSYSIYLFITITGGNSNWEFKKKHKKTIYLYVKRQSCSGEQSGPCASFLITSVTFIEYYRESVSSLP